MTYLILSSLFALAAPLVLLPIEMILPYPHLLEEIVKLGLIWMIISGESELEQQYSWIWVLGVGILFSLSETALYLFNFLHLGSAQGVLFRIFLTGSMHTLTPLILYFFAKKNRLWAALGLLVAIAVHYGFNQVATLF